MKLFGGLLFACGLWIGMASFVVATSELDSSAKKDAINEGISEQIEYMVSSAAQVRERILEADVTPPMIIGLEDLVVKVGDTLSYKRGVTVTDDSGADIKLVVDNSAVDLSKLGTYTVVYSATDLTGNCTTKEVLVTVIEQDPIDPEVVYALADALIAEKTTDDMSQWDKVYTLWNWCRTKIKYSYSAGARTVYEAAYEGLHDRKGDCYIYYATMEVLLDRLGIENMKVARVGGVSNHWWNLVNLGDGWYHCDASPRQKKDPYKCFMQTDEQVAAYTVYYEAMNPGHPNYYTFDKTLYPERGTEILYDGKMNPLP